MDYLFNGEVLEGRQDIFTAVEITRENVLDEVNKALALHFVNKEQEDFLYNYRRGIQPILARTKERNGDVCCNKVIENHAEEIVAFKNGYLLPTSSPIYTARNEESSDKVLTLNEYVYRSGKYQADNELVDWFHTVGKAYLFVEPFDDIECPFRAYSLDPRTAEVVKSLAPGNRPAYAIHCASVEEELFVDVYTPTTYYRLFGSINPVHPTNKPNSTVYVTKIVEERPNRLSPYIPIIEYRYNATNMCAFESVLSLCDLINNIRSNSMDGIEQLIQSLLVAVNAQFEEGVDASYIRERGMLCISSTGDNKAEIKLLSESLNQADTEVLVQSTLVEMKKIVGMPFVASGGTSGNVGSAIFVNGWQSADAYAKNTEDEFRKSNHYFDEIILKILRDIAGFEISISDFALSFTRNELANIQAKAQACGTMIGFGLAPVLALEWSGLTNDPVAAYEMSKEFFEAKQGYQGEVNDYGNEQTNAYGMYEKLENTVLTELGIRADAE